MWIYCGMKCNRHALRRHQVASTRGCGGVRRVTRGAVEQVSGLVSGLASGQDEATEGLKWVPILNQVDMLGRDLGTVCYCGWVVHGLCKDRFYRSGRVLRSAALTSGARAAVSLKRGVVGADFASG